MSVLLREKPLLRAPEELMKPERLAALQPTVLSFAISLVRRMIRERWQIEPTVFDIDERGRGDAVYRIDTGSMIFHFIAFSFEPKIDATRTTRIIGRNWDMYGALIEGEATKDRIEQTRQEIPKLYRGRAPQGTLVWCRANRSHRSFDHTVERLAQGQQPDISTIAEVGYLMRNTGLDGNGTFGTKSYLAYEADHPLRTPYHAQMLCAFLMREFGNDLVEHLARLRSSKAVPLNPGIKRYLGVGNGSALGLGLWVVNHPHLVHRWLELRELALANAKSRVVPPSSDDVARLLTTLDRVIVWRSQDRTTYAEVFTPSPIIADELRAYVRPLVIEYQSQGTIGGVSTCRPWMTLCELLPSSLTLETQETVHGLLIDLYTEFAEAIDPQHRVMEEFYLDPSMPISDLLEILESEYAWAFEIDMNAPGARYYVWYKSEEAEEPRRGPRHEVDFAYDLGLDLAGEIQELARQLRSFNYNTTVGEFLLVYPEKTFIIERIQTFRDSPYHTPHMNMYSETFIPAYLTRLVNVSFYGLVKTRSRLQRALTGLIHHGAPTAADIAAGWTGEWRYPPEPIV